MAKLPGFYRWGGHPVPSSWSFGWLTGRDGDLVCVKAHIVEESPCAANWVLSPVCGTRAVALIAFALKYLLTNLDQNVKAMSGHH